MRDKLERELAGRYAIERELGRGGMATVWLARDLRHERPVAIKLLHSELAGAIAAERFVREVRVTAQLQHPGVVPVLDSGILSGGDGVQLPWYAMPFIAGESLRARIARELQLPIDESLRITQSVAAALSEAHTRGVVHRDIKPENIILDGDRVYVVDFGIAKALIDTGDERLTSTGLAIGTPLYMSPEQASGGVVDARSDEYSLAAVLYEMLAGEPPFTGPTAQVIITRRLAESARPIRPVRPTVPRDLEVVVLKALERVPADRFSTVAAFATRLDPSRVNEIGASRPWRALRMLAAAVGIVALMLGSWAVLTRRRHKAVDPALLALYQRGKAGYDSRTPAGAEDAVHSFRTAIERDSSFAPAWAGLAKVYIRTYERAFVHPGGSKDSVLQLAVTAVNRALALDSSSSDAWTARAVVFHNIDPTDDAPVIRATRKAISLDSSNAPAWHYLAASLAETGKMDSALMAWRECVRRDPTYTQGLAFMSQGHYWHKEFDSAAVWADSAVAVDPNYLYGRTNVGIDAVELGNSTKAIAAFEAGLRLSTDVEVPNALSNRALAEARSHDVQAARRTVRVADSLARAYSPAPLHTAVYIAQAYAALGDAKRAVWWLRQYPIQRDLHYQIHVRCDAPFAAIATNPDYRAILTAPARGC